MGTFRFLDEVALADCAVDLSASSLTDAFETAARALAEVTVDPATVQESIARHVTLEASSLDHLFSDWLSELIYFKDRNAEIYIRAVVRVTGEGPYRLAGRLSGGRIVPGRTERRADVKGVSLHPFVLEPRDGGWHARFVLDL